jgi:hypothetical protein
MAAIACPSAILTPYLGCLLAARYLLGWDWPQAQIALIATGIDRKHS